MALHLPRRSFLAGLLATPAIVRARSIMPVRLMKSPPMPGTWIEYDRNRNVLLSLADMLSQPNEIWDNREPYAHWRAPLLTVNRISWDARPLSTEQIPLTLSHRTTPG